MFFLFLIFSLEEFAPLKTAPPVENAKLNFASLFIKHGHVSPSSKFLNSSFNGIWICDNDNSESPRMHSSYENGLRRRYQRSMIPRFMSYPPNCESNDLTTRGQSRIRELGEFFNKYFVKTNKLLPEEINTKLFTVRSNHHDHSIRSAASFMNGFYPPQVPDTDQILIHSYGDSRADILNSGAKTCKAVEDKSKEFVKSEEYGKRLNESLSILENVKKQIKVSSSYLIPKLGSWIVSFIDNGGLPINASNEEVQRAKDDTAFDIFGFAKFSNFMAASPILRLLFKDIDASFSSNSKFTLNVVDSEPLAALAALIGDPEEKFIDFGAHLLFEIWTTLDGNSENLIRVVYNGRPLKLNGFDKETVPLNQFKMYLTTKGYFNQCDVPLSI